MTLTTRGWVAWCCVQHEERNMIDRRSKLIAELENLQGSRRDAVAAYERTGDRDHWRRACEVSQKSLTTTLAIDEGEMPAALINLEENTLRNPARDRGMPGMAAVAGSAWIRSDGAARVEASMPFLFCNTSLHTQC
jgi:hypothetical protein